MGELISLSDPQWLITEHGWSILGCHFYWMTGKEKLCMGGNVNLVTLVDRASSFTLVQRIFRKRKEDVANSMINMFSKVHTVLIVT
jgi:hypothetical protein